MHLTAAGCLLMRSPWINVTDNGLYFEKCIICNCLVQKIEPGICDVDARQIRAFTWSNLHIASVAQQYIGSMASQEERHWSQGVQQGFLLTWLVKNWTLFCAVRVVAYSCKASALYHPQAKVEGVFMTLINSGQSLPCWLAICASIFFCSSHTRSDRCRVGRCYGLILICAWQIVLPLPDPGSTYVLLYCSPLVRLPITYSMDQRAPRTERTYLFLQDWEPVLLSCAFPLAIGEPSWSVDWSPGNFWLAEAWI